MTTTIELRKLTSDWTNPHFDGRKRYGLEAHKTVRAGTKIVVRRTPGRFGEELEIRVIGIQYSHLIGPAADKIVAVSELTEAENWDEFRLLNNDVTDSTVTSLRVLDLLWQQPELRDALKAAFEIANKEDE